MGIGMDTQVPKDDGSPGRDDTGPHAVANALCVKSHQGNSDDENAVKLN